MAIIKNCIEKGNRADDDGSNPHSNGLLFSRSENLFLAVMFKIEIKSILNVIMVNLNIINIHTRLLDFLIGS